MHVLRLSRKGNKHRPFYHLVATDSRKPLNGKFNLKLGVYDPHTKVVDIDLAATQLRLDEGDQPSARAAKLIRQARRQAAAVPAGGVAQS